MRIPKFFASKLSKDRELQGYVNLCIAAFEPWIAHSGTPFFPEYTDHGTAHLESILDSAEALLTKGTRKLITPSDAAVLVLSTLLHDAALHITEDSFFALLDQESPYGPKDSDSDPQWIALWSDFLSEASRFDGRKLISLFGDSEPIRRPPLIASELTHRDRLLIGEFIRKHHHRLAHEFSVLGVPGPTPVKIRFPDGDCAWLQDLAGLVGRSHGVEFRHAADDYRSRYNTTPVYRNTHVIYLMGLLRLSDYMQAQASRAPHQIMRVKRLRSPISRREWKCHHAIQDIHIIHEDPEALYIEALPEDVHTFLRIRDWLQGLQAELDSAWSVLGETYGRVKSLQNFGYSLRRVRSNIDDVAAFSKKVNYIPYRAGFEAANPDLLKLLVKPLYGERFDIGMRELIQNAVDAVREFRAYSCLHKSSDALDLPAQDADVLVKFDRDENGKWKVEVSDRGIGMSLQTLQNYFLKVGASYRQSNEWKKHFQDDSGNSRILRSGRFGIGILAGFLLGDKITVSTRHVSASANDSFIFTASIDEDEIELHRMARSVGTTIFIVLAERWQKMLEELTTSNNHRHFEFLAQDGYSIEDPSLRRLFNNASIVIENITTVPLSKCSMPPDWVRIQHPDFEDIHWTYSVKNHSLFCNGIEIPHSFGEDRYYNRNWLSNWNGSPLPAPAISVFDPDARLPLNLKRVGNPIGDCVFAAELAESVLSDFIAFMLVFGPTALPLRGTSFFPANFYAYTHNYSTTLSAFAFTRDGYFPNVSNQLCAHNISRIFFASADTIVDSFPPDYLSGKWAIIPGQEHSTREWREYYGIGQSKRIEFGCSGEWWLFDKKILGHRQSIRPIAIGFQHLN